jgi:hypothetical protein
MAIQSFGNGPDQLLLKAPLIIIVRFRQGGLWSKASLEVRKMRNFPPSVRRHASREVLNISDLIITFLADQCDLTT